jgi:DMSO/TMAO reductase YedYZ molybdopterin-dependent catalytic subunit
MQVLKRHNKAVLVAVLIVAVLIVSLVVVQQVSRPSETMTSPPPAAPTSSPTPTEISPSPTSASSPLPTSSSSVTFPVLPPPFAPTPAPITSLLPGEVTEYQNQSLSPISSFENDFLQTSINGAQEINQTTYRLTIDGLVNQTLELTYDDVVNNFTAYQEVVPIVCVEGWSAIVLWQGVNVTDFLQAAGVSPKANTLIFYGSDGYSSGLPLSYIEQNNVILAYKMNNVTLNADTGWPFILVAQSQYGYKWVKYVTEINVSDNSSYLGYWESRGYPNNATIGSSDGFLTKPYAIAEIIGFSAVAIVVAVACYLILTKLRKKYSSDSNSRKFPVCEVIAGS